MLELQEENARLRELLSAGEPIASSMLASRVIAFDPSNWIQAITIDKGSSDGVQVGMAAITYEGVVGQVSAVGLTSAKVLLLTDHSSGVEAVLQGSRIRGIVEGAGRRSLRWRFVLEEDEVKPGDRLVTSGMDGIYPPGLFIGRVANVERNTAGMFQQIDVSPAVNMAKLEEVLLIKNTRTTEKIEATRKKK
jgi:rod shape-determining protein MreC